MLADVRIYLLFTALPVKQVAAHVLKHVLLCEKFKPGIKIVGRKQNSSILCVKTSTGNILVFSFLALSH